MYLSSFDGLPLFYDVLKPKIVGQNTLTVVLLHGLGGDSNALIPLARALQNHLPDLQIILPDLRGHGLSTKKYPQNAKCIEAVFTKDLHFFLKKLKIKNFTLVGHSMGGIVVQEYLSQHLLPSPRRSSVICSLPQAPNTFLFRNFWFKILKKLPLNASKRYQKRSPEFHLSLKDYHEYYPPRVSTDIHNIGGLLRWLLIYGSVFGWKSKNTHSLNTPKTTYILGKRDLVLPLFYQKIRLKKVPKALKIFLDSNHLLPLSQTNQVTQCLVEDLKELL